MVIVIDGNHLACRNYYSREPLTTKAGKETHLIYGFLSSYRKLVRQFKGNNNYFFITWDCGGVTERHKIYPEYKGDRISIGGSFYEQVTNLKAILDFLDVNQFGLEGYEGDDFVGTITYQARKLGHKVLIVSCDHDFEQLITSNVQIYAELGKNKIIKDYNWINEKYSLDEPKKLIEMMALTGDNSDYIKGIDGVGEKTAINLLKANNGLDNLLKTDQIKIYNRKNIIVDASQKIQDKIKSNKKIIKRNRILVTIRVDLPIQIKLIRKENDFEILKEAFEKLEFEKYLDSFNNWKKDLMWEN